MFIQWVLCLFTLALNSAVEFDPKYGANLTKKQFLVWMLIPIYPFILITVKAFKRLP
jgi:hypothetical protein